MTGGTHMRIGDVLYVGAPEDVWSTTWPLINSGLRSMRDAMQRLNEQIATVLVPAVLGLREQLVGVLRAELIRQEFEVR